MIQDFQYLCSPAKLYLAISMLAIIIIFAQNLTSKDKYCIGMYQCNATLLEVVLFFIFKLVYVLFWTWILNLICKSGERWIAWMLVLIPLLLNFLAVVLVVESFNSGLRR